MNHLLIATAWEVFNIIFNLFIFLNFYTLLPLFVIEWESYIRVYTIIIRKFCRK